MAATRPWLRLFLRQPLHVGLDQRQLLPSLGQPLAGVFVQQGDVALGQQLVARCWRGVQRLQQQRARRMRSSQLVCCATP